MGPYVPRSQTITPLKYIAPMGTATGVTSGNDWNQADTRCSRENGKEDSEDSEERNGTPPAPMLDGYPEPYMNRKEYSDEQGTTEETNWSGGEIVPGEYCARGANASPWTENETGEDWHSAETMGIAC